MRRYILRHVATCDSHQPARPDGHGPVRACALCIAWRRRCCWRLLSAAGGVLGAPIIHEVGLSLAMIMGAISLGRGILEHGYSMPSAVGGLGLGVMAGALTLPHDGSEALYTVIGVGILALGHRLNVIAAE